MNARKVTPQQYAAMVARETEQYRKRKPHLTGAQFKNKLDQLAFTQVGFAQAFDLGERTVRDWIAGKYPVPTTIAAILMLIEKSKLTREDFWQ